mgnify:CR=1 FL=1
MRTLSISMVWVPCKNCGKEAERHAKGLCITCYKKLAWKPKKIICKRCKREMPHHSHGLCPSCYNFVFHLQKTKEYNYLKKHGISPELYNKITKKCVICGFDKIVDLHHLDENKKNISEENMIGLCPNHHKMFHDFRFKKEIVEKLQELGYKIPRNVKLDFSLN